MQFYAIPILGGFFAVVRQGDALFVQLRLQIGKAAHKAVHGLVEGNFRIQLRRARPGANQHQRIAQLVFGIPAIRGLEFGTGFEAASLRGSVHNDPYYTHVTGEVRTKTNHHGGILGGITSGMPLIFRAAVKPTPSIALEQSSVSLSAGEDKKLVVHGRHDPCIVPRAVPVMEAAAAAAIYDAYLCSK